MFNTTGSMYTNQQQPTTWQSWQQPVSGVGQQTTLQQPLYTQGIQQQPLYQQGYQQVPLQSTYRQQKLTGMGPTLGMGTGMTNVVDMGMGMGSGMQQSGYMGGRSMLQQNVPFNVLGQECPSDENFAQDIENDPNFNQIIDQIIARIPPEACGVRPPRHRREERYVNSDCPPRTATIRRRLPSPPPDIIERHTIIRAPQDTINVVIEKPGMPPPCVFDKTDYEPDAPPRIQHAVVCVQPSSRCPPGSMPDQGGNNEDDDDNFRRRNIWPIQPQQQMTSRFAPVQQQNPSRFYPVNTSQFIPQTSYNYMPQQQVMSQKYQFQPMPIYTATPYNQLMRQNYNYKYQPISQTMGYQMQTPNITYPYYQQQIPQQMQSTYNSQFTSAPIYTQFSDIQPQQQTTRLRSPFSNPELLTQQVLPNSNQYISSQSPSLQQQQQSSSYFWPQTQPQQTMQGQDVTTTKTRGLVI